ncbi:MAG: ATP-binding cassette domain-containing protein, partial [Desulfobacteraceae bacterium]
MEPILNVKNLTMTFGGLKALDSVDLTVRKGQIAALIGPNGAGKTTFFNCITGIYSPSEGVVEITPPGKATQKINGIKPNHVTERGMARTFQNIRLFHGMTVLENVMLGRHCRLHSGILGAMFRPKGQQAEEKKVVNDCYEILEKIGLEEFVNEMAINLPYGAQR